MTKFRTLSPDMIMTIVAALIIFAIGIYAVFTVVGMMTPTLGSNLKSGQGVLGNPYGVVLTNNNTNPRYVPCNFLTLGYYNSTTGIVVEAYCKATAGSYSVGWNTQTTANGTFMSNNTYRITGGTFFGHNSSYRITYLSNPIGFSQYQQAKNTTGLSNNVFNVVGVILIVGAIMTIIDIIYSYIGKGKGGQY